MREKPRKSDGMMASMAYRHFDTLLGESAKSLGSRMYSIIVLVLLLAFGIPQKIADQTPKAIGAFAQAIVKGR